jgi:hypothetical protein
VKFIRANEPRAARNLVQAVVQDSALQRALYIAISAVAPMPFASSTFADPELARQWLLEKLAGGPEPTTTTAQSPER